MFINAWQNYTSSNSMVTTQAAQSSGGNITALATDMVQLTNNQLNALVQGSATMVGGNSTIDLQYVIRQNSQILAQTTQGQGGAISITIINGGLFLSDVNSTVSASSKRGVNGTVTIQSPNAPASGRFNRWENRRCSRPRCSTNVAHRWLAVTSVTSPWQAGTVCLRNWVAGSPARLPSLDLAKAQS